MQDAIALVIAAVAAAWLARSLLQRLAAPPCQPPSAGPPGSDGFVPLDALSRPENDSGRPAGRPEHSSADDARRSRGSDHQYMS